MAPNQDSAVKGKESAPLVHVGKHLAGVVDAKTIKNWKTELEQIRIQHIEDDRANPATPELDRDSSRSYSVDRNRTSVEERMAWSRGFDPYKDNSHRDSSGTIEMPIKRWTSESTTAQSWNPVGRVARADNAGPDRAKTAQRGGPGWSEKVRRGSDEGSCGQANH